MKASEDRNLRKEIHLKEQKEAKALQETTGRTDLSVPREGTDRRAGTELREVQTEERRSSADRTDLSAVRREAPESLQLQAAIFQQSLRRRELKSFSIRIRKETNLPNWITAAKRTNRKFRSVLLKSRLSRKNTTSQSL